MAPPEALEVARRAGLTAAEEARAGRGTPLYAGFARAEIRSPVGPEVGVNLAGYGVRAGIYPAPAEAIRDPCCARAIALANGEDRTRTFVLLAADLLYVNEQVRARVLEGLERAGMDPTRTYFTATHSHSAPGNFAIGAAEAVAVGRYREDCVRPLVDALVAAACEAVRTLAPAEVLVARTAAPRYVRNRYWKSSERIVPLDADLTALWFRAPSGPLRGVLAVFGAHATVIGPERPVISGDWPGGFSRTIEAGPDAPVALFAAGAVGSQSPRADDSIADDYARADALGKAVAEQVRALADAPGAQWQAAPGVGLQTREIPLPTLSFRLSPEWRASPALLSALYPAAPVAPLSVLRIGADALVGFPAEISGEVSLDMKRAAAANGVRLTVTSFAGAYHGYVPPDEYYGRWRYENRLSIHGPGFGAFLTALAERATAR